MGGLPQIGPTSTGVDVRDRRLIEPVVFCDLPLFMALLKSGFDRQNLLLCQLRHTVPIPVVLGPVLLSVRRVCSRVTGIEMVRVHTRRVAAGVAAVLAWLFTGMQKIRNTVRVISSLLDTNVTMVVGSCPCPDPAVIPGRCLHLFPEVAVLARGKLGNLPHHLCAHGW